ncbi:DUF3862 domain-containing protein [Enterococcus faecalis]|uniref:DUF3862 domain-containing protein n=1 Tax=Enterococcus faecalis TaxID=1351 RepID=UPI000352BE10|nr:DUF3862 domain-containing protein [Enterococcus faecalis]EPH85030.1 hypothetical protein D924_01231 [Enterococcus faecalis 06-MB-S-10]EPH85381.1 hypothetical protein D927_00366 [Enterococcus faecalis 02-MB-BW-10]EPH92731.1 hypothetical protein D923_00005 [Enterococcus faecalis 06-MB-S-04]
MDKKLCVIGGIIVAIFICIGAMFVTRNENKKEVSELIKTEENSAKEVKSIYDKLIIGKGFEEVNKKLGSPLYTESSTDNSGNSETIYTWGSNKTDEIGAKLTINTENNNVVEKSISGLYTPYDKEKVVSSEKFEKIQLNKDFSTEKAIQQFGEPNEISEYKNEENKTVQTLTWETNTTGSIGSYFVIVFTNNIATSKNEIGLV